MRIRSGGRKLGGLLVALSVLALPACTSDDSATPGPGTAKAEPALVEAIAADITEHPDCEFLDPTECLLPFPSSNFETDDDATETGRRIALPETVMPVNAQGAAVDPEPYTRNDGWAISSPILVSVPDLDVERSGYPTEADPAASLSDDSPTSVIDLTTGERLAHWVELDSRTEVDGMGDDPRTTVVIRTAALLPEGHRIAVSLEQPVDSDGSDIDGSDAFAVYRDSLTTGIDAVESRRPAMEELFDGLADAGVERDDLWLAWDFQTMSTENLTGDLLAMRDTAFEQLGDDAPGFTITEVLTSRDDGRPLPVGIGRWIRGTYEVPSFLDGDGSPGSSMTRDDEGEPVVNGTYDAEFMCALTQAQLDGSTPARPVVYGHGLLGSLDEAERSDLGTADANLMLCATYWVGMSDPDIGFAVGTLQDVNTFPGVVDRLRQGIVNQLFLARLIGHDDGLAAAPELAAPDGTSSLDTSEVFYEGHSQGGIMGFAATAVSNEWSKAIIGVPGVGYATLIPRSNNWERYGPVIAAGYPGVYESLVIEALTQQLWDRGEGAGYVRYLTGGLPGTRGHQVIIQVALGDHQVANATADTAARTAGVAVRAPVAGDGRLGWVIPPTGLDTAEADPDEAFDVDSLMVYWDAGTFPPPMAMLSPDTTDEWLAECSIGAEGEEVDEDDLPVPCQDPHEFPRRTPAAQRQRDHFFDTGEIIEVCGSGPCVTEPR